MKLEDQVCTKRQGEKLEELGVKVMPLFCYCYVSSTFGEGAEGILPTGNDFCDIPDLGTTWIAPAFTTAELGVMLPDYLTIESYRMHFHSHKQEQGKSPALWTGTFGKTLDRDVPDFDNNNEAQMRAALLIHLLESKLITSEQVNDKLK